MTESELVSACILQNRFGQQLLYDRYKKSMYTLAYRILGDFDSANDVLQDSFLDVFKQMQNFRNESSLGAWIKTIVIRKAYKTFRKLTLIYFFYSL